MSTTPDAATNGASLRPEEAGREWARMGWIGGDRGTRTPNLGIANAALSQLSYIPTPEFGQPQQGAQLKCYSNPRKGVKQSDA